MSHFSKLRENKIQTKNKFFVFFLKKTKTTISKASIYTNIDLLFFRERERDKKKSEKNNNRIWSRREINPYEQALLVVLMSGLVTAVHFNQE